MRTIALSELSDERLAPFLRLSDHQLRDRKEKNDGVMVVESRFVLRTALAQGLTPLALLLDERHLDRMRPELEGLGDDIPVFTAPRALLSELVGFNVTRGYYGAFVRPEPRSLAEVTDGARLVGVLDGLVDATNVGAIFRSAAALGADALLLSPTCADPYSRRALRVSMGTSLTLPWARLGGDGEAVWPAPALEHLRADGFHVAAMALADDATPLGDPRLAAHERMALVFGTEGWGLADDVLACCDETVMIPMAPGVDSLNVAASSAVAFWELGARLRAVRSPRDGSTS